MRQGLYSKLVFIMLLLILSLMLVVGVFLTRGVSDFYTQRFYEQMQTVFADQSFASGLRSAASEEDAAQKLSEVLRTYAGSLGVDSRTRNYYILSGETGEYLTGSRSEVAIGITPNVLAAVNGSEGYQYDPNSGYMDVAIPLSDELGGEYIIWVLDNTANARELSGNLMNIIFAAIGIGLVISIMLSMLLAKALVTPIQNLTVAADRVAGGDFDSKLENTAKDEIGTLTRTFNNMADQLENTLDNLKKSEAMRREFVADVSHELRTPITSIRSYAETLSENASQMPAETEQEFLQVIVTESDRMTKIVQDLLTLSRFDAGSFTLKMEEFSFEKSVRDVYNAMLLESEHRRQSFKVEFKNDPGVIYGDKVRVEQVLMNLISNAIKYTPDGGRIHISAGRIENTVWATVRDNGVGIPQKDIGHVFDRFYRVDKARSRESGGTGLGLSIAREIVARHDGELTIESKFGKGTSITMTLPAGGKL